MILNNINIVLSIILEISIACLYPASISKWLKRVYQVVDIALFKAYVEAVANAVSMGCMRPA